MPAASEFLKHFGLNKRLKLTYKLTSVDIKHVEIIQYRKYEYPMILIFQVPRDSFKNDLVTNDQKLINSISQFIKTSGEKIIKSQYGNDYNCFIKQDSLKIVGIEKDQVSLTCTGYANRILYKM